MSPTPMTDAELTAIEAHSSTAIEARLLAEVRRLRAELARPTFDTPEEATIRAELRAEQTQQEARQIAADMWRGAFASQGAIERAILFLCGTVERAEQRRQAGEIERLQALVAALRELLEEREWDFEEDRGYECNSCRSCGVTLRHGQPRKHKSGCQLDATLREPPP